MSITEPRAQDARLSMPNGEIRAVQLLSREQIDSVLTMISVESDRAMGLNHYDLLVKLHETAVVVSKMAIAQQEYERIDRLRAD